MICALVIWLDHRSLVKKHQRALASPTAMLSGDSQSLTDRIGALAKNLFGFLAEVGDENPPSIGYIMRVHGLFLRDWYPEVEAVANEIGIVGYVDFKFGTLVGNHHEAFGRRRIQEIAEYLLKIKSDIELKGYRKATLTQVEVDNMTSTELRKLFADPLSQGQIELLHRFKQPS